MGRVGDFDMWHVEQALVRSPRRFQLFQKHGYAGRGSHIGPRDANMQGLLTIAWADDQAAAQALWESYQAAEGDTVDIVDGLAQQWDDATILAVFPAIARNSSLQAFSPATGVPSVTGSWVVMVEWLVLLAEDTQT